MKSMSMTMIRSESELTTATLRSALMGYLCVCVCVCVCVCMLCVNDLSLICYQV
jgi:hypothetical protein